MIFEGFADVMRGNKQVSSERISVVATSKHGLWWDVTLSRPGMEPGVKRQKLSDPQTLASLQRQLNRVVERMLELPDGHRALLHGSWTHSA